MEEFKGASDEPVRNKKKKIIGGAAGILALFTACKIFRKFKKRKQKKEEEAQDDM